MTKSDGQTLVHSGNYYQRGIDRVAAKLRSMGISVPDTLIVDPPSFRIAPNASEERFSPMLLAMLEWFEGRDYDQAQALIHFQPNRHEWQVIRILEDDKVPGLTQNTLCPSVVDAIAAIIDSYDSNICPVDSWYRDGRSIVASIDGVDALQIDPIRIEPFSQKVRDRVRTALKGVRKYNAPMQLRRLAKLPGFNGIAVDPAVVRNSRAENDGCMLIGYPANWAFAMRSALKSVGIEVKQAQAQELAAVFLGAEDWHHLIKHQDEINDQMRPVALEVNSVIGVESRFYRTPEEGLFALAKLVETFPEPLILAGFGLVFGIDIIGCDICSRQDWEATAPDSALNCPSFLELGRNDYWSIDENARAYVEDASKRVLRLLEAAGEAIFPAPTRVL